MTTNRATAANDHVATSTMTCAVRLAVTASTSAALALVDTLTASLTARVMVLVATWSLAALARFVVIGGSR